MHAPSEDSPPAPASLGGQRGGAPQSGQQVRRVGGIQAGQGEPHGQGVAVQPFQQFPERPALPPPLRGRVRGQQVTGVLRRPRPGSARPRRSGGPGPASPPAPRLVMITVLAE